MIRSMERLRAALAEGRTIARMANLTEAGFRICEAETGETVHQSTLNALVRRGEARVLSTDICGDPMQWGRA